MKLGTEFVNKAFNKTSWLKTNSFQGPIFHSLFVLMKFSLTINNSLYSVLFIVSVVLLLFDECCFTKCHNAECRDFVEEEL